MMNTVRAGAAALAVVLGAVPVRDLKSLVRAELAFSKLSEAQGIRAAFVANLAEDAIVFRPRPVPGLKLYQDRPAVPGYLSWRPVLAVIAASGDLGFTTGPYELRKQSESDPIGGRGHFVSIWSVQRDGAWKVVFDGGIDYEAPFAGDAALDPDHIPTAAGAGPAAVVDPAKAEAEIRGAERALAAAVAKGGTGALADLMSPDARLNLAGSHPFKGGTAARGALATMRGVLTWEIQGLRVSAAGDLGFVYGLSELRPASGTVGDASSASFLRIWKKNAAGRWEIALALFSPIK